MSDLEHNDTVATAPETIDSNDMQLQGNGDDSAVEAGTGTETFPDAVMTSDADPLDTAGEAASGRPDGAAERTESTPDEDGAPNAAESGAPAGTTSHETPTPAVKAGSPGQMPGFLTREEYEQIGDDPEPLPKDFEVVEGGAGAAGHATPRAAGSAEPAGGSAPNPNAPAPAEGVAQAVSAVGSFLSTGMESVRAMNAARRAHADAREALEQLQNQVRKQEEELEHRRDITGRYDAIMQEQTARRDAAGTARTEADAERERLEQQAGELKGKLQQAKDADAATEKRLKSALDAAEAKEEQAREAGSRLQRRLDDAERSLKNATQERDEGAATAQRAIDSARDHLATLRTEFAEVQRNPSANSAEYSVRSVELQNQISDAAEALRMAQQDLPRATADLSQAVEAATAALSEAQKPMDAAKRTFKEAQAEADKARDAHASAKKEAEARQKELRRQITELEKDAKEQEQASQRAAEEAAAAQAALDEADDIRSHPEVTEAIAGALAADRAELEEREAEVDELAAAERDVRERTRGSRVKFIAAIAGVLAIIVLLVVFFFIAPR